jgi:hypothetical protein
MNESCNGQGPVTIDPPGRPPRRRRAIEREYLATLSEAVSLDDWREIVLATVGAAKVGDARAREWLTRLLIGTEPLTITELAIDEACEYGPEQEIEGGKSRKQSPSLCDDFDKLLSRNSRPTGSAPAR